jgi:hypothetical protein
MVLTGASRDALRAQLVVDSGEADAGLVLARLELQGLLVVLSGFAEPVLFEQDVAEIGMRQRSVGGSRCKITLSLAERVPQARVASRSSKARLGSAIALALLLEH